MNKFNTLLETYFSRLSEDKMPKMFSPSSKVEYSFEDEVKAGTLSEDEMRIYGSVDKGSSYTGADLLDYLKDEIKFDPREDLNVSKIKRILNNLLDKDVLVATLVSRGDDTEIPALDTMDNDMEFKSREDVLDVIDPSFKKTPRYFESIQEAKKSYSAKQARKGKDIGKPGKMFSKIAKSASKKYGSEEAGKKVAGAILKKLRSK